MHYPTKTQEVDKRPKNSSKMKEVNYIFHIDDDVTVTCTLGGVMIDTLINSLIKCNIINEDTWRKLKNRNVKVCNQEKKKQIKHLKLMPVQLR